MEAEGLNLIGLWNVEVYPGRLEGATYFNVEHVEILGTTVTFKMGSQQVYLVNTPIKLTSVGD